MRVKGLPTCPHISDSSSTSRHQVADPQGHPPAHDLGDRRECGCSPGCSCSRVGVPLRTESLQDSTTSAIAQRRTFQGLGDFQAVADGSDTIRVPGMAPGVCLLLPGHTPRAGLSHSIAHYCLMSLLKLEADLLHSPKCQVTVLKA